MERAEIEEETGGRGGINNFYYGGVQKVINLTVDKKVFKKAVGAVLMPGGKKVLNDLIDIKMNRKTKHQ